ncbi:FecR family protein [Sphingobacterium prati]|uniref:FecR family protein n=1 Tax=Sphingobacterium prati TaxID=2737006 RepID=UPI001554DC82|nr:FecR family protein [Sphingobacterium prati]NPE47750.1 FecR family protein [Sphingobacterium prati]
MQHPRFEELFNKYLNDTLTKDEMLELQLLLASDDQEQSLRSLIDNEMAANVEEYPHVELNWFTELETNVLANIRSTRSKTRYLNWNWKKTVAAAALLVVSIGASLLMLLRLDNDERNTIKPGTSIASLRLADGREIALSNKHESIVFGDELMYADGASIEGLESHESVHQDMVITVPKGGTYHIMLADGSKIWLNSDSRLTYKIRSKDQPRELGLEGEAFFEVATSYIFQNNKRIKVPFLVKTPAQTVQVLGTAFNISAYRGEATRTTLVEGKVAINLKGNKKLHQLQPNQQAIVQNNSISFVPVDPVNYVSWKDGTFTFSDEDLNHILNQIGRWYNVQVEYEDESLRKLKFEGVLPRNQNLSFVLEALASTGEVQFTVNSNTVYVKRK